MTRNKPLLLAIIFVLFIFFSYTLIPGPSTTTATTTTTTTTTTKPLPRPSGATTNTNGTPLPDTIMPTLTNETLKAELGRASWKLIHTTLARFPEKPTPEERAALSQYLDLFARLYPCGECAEHFQKILREYPAQTSGRAAASQWGCFVHNLVNVRLGKAEFDCMEVGEAYKCGCDEEDGKGKGKGKGKGGGGLEEKVKGSGREVEVLHEGLTNGG